MKTRDAIRRFVIRLRADAEMAAMTTAPPTDDELARAEVADWGPAEDWSDWAEAAV